MFTPSTRGAEDGIGAVASLGGIKTTSVVQYPSGTWGFAGRVPIKDGFVNKDGSDLTDAEADALAKDLPFGHGMAKSKHGVKERRFATEAEAKSGAVTLDGRVVATLQARDLRDLS